MTELDRYLREGWITSSQHAAGIRFCRDARAARVELAAHVLGPHRHVLLALARGMGASTWAGQAGLPHAEGMARLRVALDALVRLEARDAG